MMVVTAKIEFIIGGIRFSPGDKLIVTEEEARDLIDRGLIKSITKPIIDKMIREPKRRK